LEERGAAKIPDKTMELRTMVAAAMALRDKVNKERERIKALPPLTQEERDARIQALRAVHLLAAAKIAERKKKTELAHRVT
jgi:hypothetical protein